jgi:hypothetical protein
MSSNFGLPLSNPAPSSTVVTVAANATLSGLSYGNIYYVTGAGSYTITLPGLAVANSTTSSSLTVVNDSAASIIVAGAGSNTIRVLGNASATVTLGIGERVTFSNFGTYWVADTSAFKASLSGATFTGAVYLPTLSSNDNSLKAVSSKFVNDLLSSRAYAPLADPTFTGIPIVPDIAPTVVTSQAVNAKALAYAAPPGTVAYFATTTAPSGWLICDGSALAVASYPALTTAMYVGDSINATTDRTFGVKFTSTAMSTRSTSGAYINIPDLRGVFIRSWASTGTNYDSGRSFGTTQGAQVGYFTWYVTADDGDAQTGSLHSVLGLGINGDYVYAPNVPNGVNSATYIAWITPSDNRPTNVALLACIKY